MSAHEKMGRFVAYLDQAEAEWNVRADESNQWIELDQSERYELFALVIEKATIERCAKICGHLLNTKYNGTVFYSDAASDGAEND